MGNTIEKRNTNSVALKIKLVKFFLSSEFMAVMFIIVLSLVAGAVNENFFSTYNILRMLRNCSFVGIVSIGQALIIMSGEMDLSTGAVGVFGSVIFGIMCIWDSYPVWLGLLVALLFCCLMGWLNGFLMLRVGVMKWVATLATGSLCGGLAGWLCNGTPIEGLPEGMIDFAYITINPGEIFGRTGLSIFFIIFVALMIIAQIVIRYTKYGRMIQACGISADAAYMAGVNVVRVKWVTLVVVAISAFLATMFDCMRIGTIALAAIDSFKSIAACYIGGIGFVGSTGSMFGLFLGVILMQLLENVMSALQWDSNAQIAMIGALLMLVLTIDVFKRRYIASRIDLL